MPNWQTYIMIAVYFLILIVIGFYGYKQATGNLSEYMLGGRSIGPYIIALSAGASDMSGWMIMGLPRMSIALVYQLCGLQWVRH
ncbi:sodium:solute symporter family transporter [Staphylococcus aureus]